MKEVKFGAATSTERVLSPLLWKDFDLNYMDNFPDSGVYVDDDFGKTFPLGIAATGVAGPYYTFFSSAATVTPSLVYGGGLILTPGDADAEAVSLQRRVQRFRVGAGMGKLMFEASIQVADIANDASNFFFGLTDGTANTATVPITASDALAAVGSVGFLRSGTSGNGAKLNFVYCDASGTPSTPVLALTLVAATTYRVGFAYDPTSSSAALQVYVDGQPVSGVSLTAAQVADAAFPQDLYLNTCYGAHAMDTTPTTVTVFGGRCAQKAV